jgi:uncharacterized protein with HEPN domain
MKKRDFKLFLKDMLDSIDKIEQFTAGMDVEDFLNDEKTSSAVIRKLEIIGEAVKQLPPKIAEENKDIPWKEMAGMRDKLIHWYFGVDYQVVWNVVKKELPALKPLLKEIFDKIEADKQSQPQSETSDNKS